MSNDNDDTFIDKDGVVYEKGWNGEYRPKQGLFGVEKDTNWRGQPNLKQDFLGRPEEERDFLGRPTQSRDGDTLYRRENSQRSGGSGGGGGGGGSSSSSGGGDNGIFWLGVIYFGIQLLLIFIIISPLIIPFIIGGWMIYNKIKSDNWNKVLVVSCFITPAFFILAYNFIDTFPSILVPISLGFYYFVGIIGWVFLIEKVDIRSFKFW